MTMNAALLVSVATDLSRPGQHRSVILTRCGVTRVCIGRSYTRRMSAVEREKQRVRGG